MISAVPSPPGLMQRIARTHRNRFTLLGRVSPLGSPAFLTKVQTMLDHISLGVTDLRRSRRFYDAALRAIGLVRIVDFEGVPGSDYGSMPGPLGVEFTITVKLVLVYRLLNPLSFVAFKMGRRQGARRAHI